MSAIDLLDKTPLFAGLPEDELSALARRLGKRTFAKGMILFHKDSLGQTLYLIECGRVRIFVTSESGQEITLNLHGPGDYFGELALLDGLPRSAGAVAVERTVTYTLHREDFLACMEQNPAMSRRMLELMTQRLRKLTERVESLTFLDVSGRVAVVLLELADSHGLIEGDSAQIDLGLSQTELATWVGASREMVNKVLGNLRSRGLIEMDGRTITIVDMWALRQQVAC